MVDRVVGDALRASGDGNPTGRTGGVLARVPDLRRLPGPTLMAIVLVLYLAVAQLSIWLNDPVQLGAAFWPAAGLSLGLLLLLDRSVWPWVLGGVAFAEISGDLVRGSAPGAIAFWTVGNVVEPLVAALLIRRFSSEHGSLVPLRSLLGFLLWGVVVGPLVGGTIGSIGTVIFQGHPPALVWPKYVIGDALGVLVVAPVLLGWGHPAPSKSTRSPATSWETRRSTARPARPSP